jgi:quercetin dioxygenase-like cupin family protein
MPSPLNTIKVLGEVDVSHYIDLFSDIDDADWMGAFAKFSKRYIPFFNELERLPLLYSMPKDQEGKTIEESASTWKIADLIKYMNSDEYKQDVVLNGELYDKYYNEEFFESLYRLLTDQLGKGKYSMFMFNLMNPHSQIAEHKDERTGDNKRIHIPIVTDPDVTFMNNGDTVNMEVGKVYWIDHTKIHSVDNPTDCERIHLVIDWKLDGENYV